MISFPEKIKTKKKAVLFLILGGLFFLPFPASAEETLRLEGIIEDQANPKESLAVINGGLYQREDFVGPYRVEDIQANEVKLFEPDTREILMLQVKAAAPVPPQSAEPAPSASVPPTLLEQAKLYLGNPSKAVNRAWEIKALRDLAVINNAAVKYYEKNGFFPVSMRQLTLDGFLPQEYEAGEVHKYRFYFKNTPQKPDDFQLHADPLEGGKELRFFFIGTDAVIRESFGSPAQLKSPPHNYPGKKA